MYALIRGQYGEGEGGEELGVKGGGQELSICYAVSNTAGVCSRT